MSEPFLKIFRQWTYSMKGTSNKSSDDMMTESSMSFPLHQQFLSLGEKKGKLHVAIIDDEALARRAVRRAVEVYPEIEVVAECSDGTEALKVLQDVRPELVFLDVEMPQLSGFDVVRQLKPNEPPYIVFVTAHEKYALDAFKVHAVDYLVKPISEGKIAEVLERVLHQVQQNKESELDSRLDSILKLIGNRDKELQRPASLERIAVRGQGRIYFVETSSIDWIEADGNYVTLHTGSAKHLLRSKMNHLETRLDANIFVRIHRSTIVNIRSVKEFRLYFNGTFMLLLKSGDKIYSSRGYRKRVEQVLNQTNAVSNK